MPFDGNGVFDRVHNWQVDRDNAIKIVADRHDEEDNNLAAGLSSVIVRDGQSTILADLPMNGFKLTEVGPGTARDEYVDLASYQDGKIVFGADTGTANAIQITPSPAILGYVIGMKFYVQKIASPNTGPITFNVNSFGATPIKTLLGTDPASSELPASSLLTLMYDGTNFILLSKSATGMLDRMVTASTTFASTAAEETLYSYTVPANTLGADRKIRFEGTGRILNNTGAGTPTFNVRAKFGGTTLNLNSAGLGANAQFRTWELTGFLVARGSTTTQNFHAALRIGGAVGGGVSGVMTQFIFSDEDSTPQNTAIANVFEVTGQTSISDPNLSFRLTTFDLELP